MSLGLKILAIFRVTDDPNLSFHFSIQKEVFYCFWKLKTGNFETVGYFIAKILVESFYNILKKAGKFGSFPKTFRVNLSMWKGPIHKGKCQKVHFHCNALYYYTLTVGITGKILSEFPVCTLNGGKGYQYSKDEKKITTIPLEPGSKLHRANCAIACHNRKDCTYWSQDESTDECKLLPSGVLDVTQVGLYWLWSFQGLFIVKS